ncbi:MAG: OmpA family protein [Campylobacterales bacterium]|nr:OmpA family protein [Campylobacterales bacterium]
MKKLNDSQNNFWISYADLMAGLLFVFILVVGIVIMKYSYITAELQLQKESIEKLEIEALNKQEDAEKLKQELENTKEMIHKLASVKSVVIDKLRKKLGNKIAVNPKDGTLSIAGNILFDQDEYTLKNDAKIALKGVLNEYIDVLMNEKEIRDNLERIIIEGHTNSDGEYLHNLELSQKRALEVMKFILTLQPKLEKDLKVFIAASGRSDTDLVYENNSSVEDKLASRRIEIKFRLKNDEAISEISKMLDEK